MNKVKKILREVSDQDLQLAIKELSEAKATGILSGGVVRNLASKMQAEVDMPFHTALDLCKSALIEQAAFKWAEIDKSVIEQDS